MTDRKALNLLIKYCCYDDIRCEEGLDFDEVDDIKLRTRSIKKKIKALEIIKNKEINIKDITETTDDYDLYVAYCEGKGYAKEYICDKKEFNLLKEVL